MPVLWRHEDSLERLQKNTEGIEADSKVPGVQAPILDKDIVGAVIVFFNPCSCHVLLKKILKLNVMSLLFWGFY